MRNTSLTIIVLILCLYACCFASLSLHGDEKEGGGGVPVVVPAGKHGTVVKKDDRMDVVTAEYGEVSSVKVSDGKDGFYHLQFITMEPNSLFLPVHLHSDMVFYVQSGSGTLSWVDLRKDDDKLRQVDLQTGDVYRLTTGSFFYIQSNLESDRRKLRINAIFSDSREEIREGSTYGAYSSVRDLVLGFDNIVLQAALNVDEGALQELKSSERQPLIVRGMGKVENLLDVHYRIVIAFMGRMKNGMINGMIDVNKKDKKKKDKAYNILDAKHDVKNCNGWSLVVTSKQLDALKDSDFGIFMVNLTKGSMMGPHWNPMTAEIAVVLNGRGMVHVVCPSTLDETECKNSRFRVEEGDVFIVPRYHPMAQISFNNGSFVFMGFTTTQKNNHPQYLVGTASVFQALDKNVMVASLGVSNTTMDKILSAQREAIILQCTSCAEEEERLMEEEIQREEEAARKREEEEEAKRKEEEARKKEEEEAKKREEEKRKKEEEAKREQEEARKKEEEEAKQREEEKRRQEEEEEARKQREEEEEARKQREEEEAARQEQEATRRHEEEARPEEEAARRRQQEEEEAARQEEEAAARRRQQEEEAAAKRRQQEEEAARQAEEEAARQRQQDDEAARRRQQEEEAARQEQQRQQEEAARTQQQEEEAARQQEEARRREDKAARKQRQQEDEARRRQQEEEAARRGGGGRGGGGRRGGGEGEAASREEEEMARRQREAQDAARGRGQGGESYEE